MNRKLPLVAILAAFLLGAGLGYLAPRVLKPAAPRPSTPPAYMLQHFDMDALVKSCKPATAKFLVAPDGNSVTDGFGFHGHERATWIGATDPKEVGAFLEYKIRKAIEEQGWHFEIGSRNDVTGDFDYEVWFREYNCNSQGGSLGGVVNLWVTRSQGDVGSVMISYNTSHPAHAARTDE